MSLSKDLVSQFAKLVSSKESKSAEATVYGEVVVDGTNKYVRVDGSDQLIPIEDGTTVVDASVGERVSVSIKDHTATVTGNVSSPAARTEDVKDVTDRVTEIEKFDLVLAERVEAQEGYIEDLQADMAEIGDLKAATAKIEQLEANDVTITGELEAANASITNLQTTKLDVEVANAQFATIDNLNANTAKINQLESDKASITDLEAVEADITKLNAEKASVKDLEAVRAEINDLDATFATIENLDAAEAKIEDLEAEDAKINGTLIAHNAKFNNLSSSYATIDFSNIGEATISKLFTDYGIIKELVIGEGTVVKELVGVTIKGDLIEAGTVKADKLVVKGSDGVFYKLNVEAGGISAEEAPDDGLHGSVIVAKSITAEKVNVHDLVAFGATIAHFHITEGDAQEVEGTASEFAAEDNCQCDFKAGPGLYEIERVINSSEANDYNFELSFTDGSYCNGWDDIGYGTNLKPGDFVKYDGQYVYSVKVQFSEGSLYSGVKASVDNTTEGVYMDSSGQFNVGNSDNFLKFFKDQNGVWKLDISADTITFGAGKKSVEEAIDEVSESTRVNSEDLTEYISATTKELESLQGQIDGSIMTWFYEYVPTNDNIPAVEWNTTELKNNHLGDLFYDTITGYCYRWQVQNNEYFWTRITDVDVTKALSDAAKAQTTADGKRRVFVTTPKPPYDIGDLWVQGSSGELMRCQTAKTESQSYAAADWIKATKYTDDTAANAAQADANALKTRVTNAETQISQNRDAIALRATKEEVTTTLGGYYTKTEADAKLEVSAESVKTEVSKTYATKQEVDDIQIGGRNLLLNSSFKENINEWETVGDVIGEQNTASGHQVVMAADVSDKSPATVQLSSKNLLDLSSIMGKTVTANGGTLSCGADGGITGSGVVTGYMGFDTFDLYLPKGKYILSASGTFSNIACVIAIRDANAAVLKEGGVVLSGGGFSFNTEDYPSYSYITVSIKRNNNVEMSGTAYFQIEKGSTATAYTPYVGSKNLFGLQDFEKSQGTIIERFENGVIYQGTLATSTPNEWANGWLYMNYSKGKVPLKVGDIVTLSVDYTLLELAEGRTEDQKVGIYLQGAATVAALSDVTPKLGEKRRIYCTYTVTKDGNYGMSVVSNSNKVKIENPQIELGSRGTPYTPYSPTGVLVGHSVTVRGKNALDLDCYSTAGSGYIQISNSYGTTISTTEAVSSITITQEKYSASVSLGSYENGYYCIYLKSIPSYTEPYMFSCDIEIISNPLSSHKIDFLFNAVGGYNSTFQIDKPLEVGKKYRAFGFWTFPNNGRQYIEVRNNGMSLVMSNIQLEKGTTATEYEPYKDPRTYTADENGLVTIDTPYSPATTVMTNAGIYLDMTYRRIGNEISEKYEKPCLWIKHYYLEKEKSLFQSVVGKLEPDTQYTLSGWLLAENVTEGSSNFGLFIEHKAVSESGSFSYGSIPFDLGIGRWTRFYVTFTTDSRSINPISEDIRIHTEDLIGDVYICDLKLERGNRVTDWTPAPEDTDGDIADAKNSVLTETRASLEIAEKGILSQVEASYVNTDSFNSYRSVAKSEVEQTADKLRIDFTGITDDIDGKLDAEIGKREKHFELSDDGLVISAGDTSVKVVVNNDLICFVRGSTAKENILENGGSLLIDDPDVKTSFKTGSGLYIVSNTFSPGQGYLLINFLDGSNCILSYPNQNAVPAIAPGTALIYDQNGPSLVRFGDKLLGYWDGNNFYGGNLMIRVDERAQFGNFAAIPRSNGNLSWLKVE